ncbi:MAG: PAS domain-containing protein [Candidatus Falkowbacteria bacterium]
MSIYILSYLHFLTFVIYLFLTVYLVYKSHKSPLNWSCALFTFCLAMWSAGFSVFHHPQTPEPAADLVMKIFSFTPYAVTSCILLFTLVFVNKKSRTLKNPFFYFLLIVFPAIFTYQTWINNMMAPVKRLYGWDFVWTQSFYVYLYFFQYAVFITISAVLLIRAYRRTADFGRRTQILWILIPTMIVYLIGTVTNVIFPLFKISVPQIANITSLVWAGGIFYAVTRFKLLTVSFSAYSDKVISIMAEALILLDKKDNIVNVNEAAIKLCGCSLEEVAGKSIYDFIGKKYFIPDPAEAAGGNINNRQIRVKCGRPEPIPVLFSSSVLTAKGKVIGRIVVLNDISRLEASQKHTELLNRELQEKIEELERFQKIAVNRELRMIELKKEIEKLQADKTV